MTDETSTENGIDSIVTIQNLAAEYRPYHVRSGYSSWFIYCQTSDNIIQYCQSFSCCSSASPT